MPATSCGVDGGDRDGVVEMVMIGERMVVAIMAEIRWIWRL